MDGLLRLLRPKPDKAASQEGQIELHNHVPQSCGQETIQEGIDVVAGDFNGASWHRKRRLVLQYDSTLEEASKNARLLVPLGFTPLQGPGGIPHECTDVCVELPHRTADPKAQRV